MCFGLSLSDESAFFFFTFYIYYIIHMYVQIVIDNLVNCTKALFRGSRNSFCIYNNVQAKLFTYESLNSSSSSGIIKSLLTDVASFAPV